MSKGVHYKSFGGVWQETVQERKSRGLAAVSSDLQPFLNRTTWPQNGERMPGHLIDAVRCREILDVSVWTRLRSRLLIVLAMLSIFGIFIMSDILPLRNSIGGVWLLLGAFVALLFVLAGLVMWLRFSNIAVSEDVPTSNAHLANHIAALHLLYVSRSLSFAAQSEMESQSGSIASHSACTRERIVHTATVCGTRYLVMQNGRVFFDM